MAETSMGSESRGVILAVSPDTEDPKFVEASMPGWSVRRAQSCDEAVTILNSCAFDVVLCERDLPDGGWHDLLNLVRGLRQAPPVVVMSRTADESMWAEVLSCGGFDLLMKPLETSDLQRLASGVQLHQTRGHAARAH
jgi:DNA-binding NtrC family response regulator